MEIICSICKEMHDHTLLCSGCMSERARDPRIPPGINERGYDLDDWQYFRLLELILSGEKLNEYEYKFLQIRPTQILTIQEAKDMCNKRIQHIQAKAKQREEEDQKAAMREAKRQSCRLCRFE